MKKKIAVLLLACMILAGCMSNRLKTPAVYNHQEIRDVQNVEQMVDMNLHSPEWRRPIWERFPPIWSRGKDLGESETD